VGRQRQLELAEQVLAIEAEL